jgi:hypothetical protein
MTNFKALCAELVHIANALDGKNALISNQGQAMDGYSALAAFRDVADRARAALAAEADGPAVPESGELASVVGQPSDKELLAMWFRKDGWEPGESLDAFEFARAVLARYGNHQAIPHSSTCKESLPVAPAPPAESEIARCLADSLKSFKLTQDPVDYPKDHWSRRAAELLQQQHLTPVPVSVEREGAND